MKLYHQTGFRFQWNIQSLLEDNSGDGLILSPVNIASDKIFELSDELKSKSYFDPQFYLPKEAKSELSTYDFFPANLVDNLKTSDFDDIKEELARKCIDFQINNNFEYIIIPTRYYDEVSSVSYEQLMSYYIDPFLNYYKKLTTETKILLTFIVKQAHIMNNENFDFLLSWLTSLDDVSGFYLIFENNFTTKQIKDPNYLFNVLKFIHILKSNNFIVNIGYNDIEGILYYIASPDAISMGSYENLRRFEIRRFTTTPRQMQSPPIARLYSGKLFQFIDYRYIDSIFSMYGNSKNIFEDSKYKPLMFKPEYNWHFQRPEPYKHFFLIFTEQIRSLPSSFEERIVFLRNSFRKAIDLFKEIIDSGVYLDENSDGSHLNFWLTALNRYEKYVKEYEL